MINVVIYGSIGEVWEGKLEQVPAIGELIKMPELDGVVVEVSWSFRSRTTPAPSAYVRLELTR